MRSEVLHILLKHAMMLCDEGSRNDRTKAVKEETVKLLCLLGTVKTNRFYIPGETNIVERLRKEAYDKGLFATLTYIYKELDKSGICTEIKKYIREKLLNLVELNDLVYHAVVVDAHIEAIKANPNRFIASSRDNSN